LFVCFVCHVEISQTTAPPAGRPLPRGHLNTTSLRKWIPEGKTHFGNDHLIRICYCQPSELHSDFCTSETSVQLNRYSKYYHSHCHPENCADNLPVSRMGKLKLIDDMDSERQTENKSSKVEVHKPQPCQLPS
jgi:hypothetical protein